MSFARAARRRAPREARHTERRLAQIAARLEHGYTPKPDVHEPLLERLARIGRRKAESGDPRQKLRPPKRARLRAGNPPGRLATRRRLERTRR